jgi:serine protease
LERGYDFVRILDGADRVVASYTGKQADFNSAVVSGDTLKVQLTTDRSVTSWGFAIDSYEVTGGCNADSECGAGKVCAQIQCIRAPCFNLCEDAPTSPGYTDVTVAELNADPSVFAGQRIRVTAEPTVRALCTRRACNEANPCCNVCSGSFVIGHQVTLRDASDQAYGCRGNECTWRGTCREFPPENTGPYTFEGQLRVDATGTVALLVQSFEAAECQIAGCSSQACANTPNVITTCDARPEYLCYQQDSACENQATGHCGWTETPALLQCLANASAERVSAGDVPMAIPDDDAQGATSQLFARGGGPISQLLISLQITHTYRGDLLVSLVSPTGTEVVLHAGDGGSANDLVILDRELPELSGEEKGGTWQLVVKDRYERDTGTLEGWTLTFR